MAGYGRDGKALLPLRYVTNMFKEQTLKQLKANMQTQRVFPYEIYPGFHTVNEYRRQLADGDHDKGWFADGEGVKSFEGEVYEADENTGMVTMGFRFNDYMQYVGISYSLVKRQTNFIIIRGPIVITRSFQQMADLRLTPVRDLRWHL